MKIAITGSHGTGKTTLLNEINHGNKLTEVAREIFKTMGKIPQDMTPEEQRNAQIDIYYGQIHKERSEAFISDRGVYDCIAYCYFVSESLYSLFLERTRLLHKGYDKVFYIPIEFELEKDGVRFEDAKFQKQIDEKIFEILNILEIDYEVLSGTIDERKNKVLDYINKNGK